MLEKEVFEYLKKLKNKNLSLNEKNEHACLTVCKYICEKTKYNSSQAKALYEGAKALADSECYPEIFSVVVSLISIANIINSPKKSEKKNITRYTEIDTLGNVYIPASKMYDAILKLKNLEDYAEKNNVDLGELKL